MTLPVETRLEEIYDKIPPSERLLADLIIDFPGVLATHPISELAERARTSNAAATRLIKRLGYKNVQELRKEMREVRKDGSPRYLNTFSIGNEGFKSNIQQHLENEIQNLIQSFNALDEQVLDAIIDRLVRARSIWIFGFGNSHMLAHYLRQQLIQLRDYAEVLPRPGQSLSKDMSGLNEDDMMIIISFRRRRETHSKLLQYGKSIGASTLYITDYPAGKAADAPDWTIRCRAQSGTLFDSYIAAYSILNYIAASLADRLGRQATKRLSQAEKIHAFLGGD